MSEIEKLYENAGVKPTKNWQSCLNCKFKTEKLYDEWGEEYFTCVMFENPAKCYEAKEYYPLFTAEKQLELIKWLLTKVIDTEHIHLEFSDRTFKFLIHSVACTGDDCDTLENALCSYINNLWQDLSDTEKAEIKRILE